jgi:superfamily I DNA and RNA helicase
MIFEEKQNKLLSISSNFPSFDYVLIDEFQDFHPRALILIYECYGDQMVFSGDFMQSQRYQSLDEVKSYNIGIVEHKQMTDNFRNTREILQHTHQIF